jgi:hypothetical protein
MANAKSSVDELRRVVAQLELDQALRAGEPENGATVLLGGETPRLAGAPYQAPRVRKSSPEVVAAIVWGGNTPGLVPITVTVGGFRALSGLGSTKTYELINRNILRTVTVDKRRLIIVQSWLDYLADRLRSGSNSPSATKDTWKPPPVARRAYHKSRKPRPAATGPPA